MKITYLSIYLVFWAILILTSCSNDGGQATGPLTQGDITGSVNLYNEATTPQSNSGMTVTVHGTDFSAITDSQGNFTISDIPFGFYTLVYQKSGYGTFKIFDVEHDSSLTPISKTPSLGKVSSTEVTGLSALTNDSEVVISITTDPAGSNSNTRYVRYFLSVDSDVSQTNYHYYSPGLTSRINPYETILSSNDLAEAGFLSGQMVYVKAFGDSFWSNEYYNPDLDQKAFPNVNTSSATAVSFVVP